MNVQRPVAGETRRPRVARDLGTDGVGPDADDRSHARRRAEAAAARARRRGRRASSGRPHHPGDTSSSCAGVDGKRRRLRRGDERLPGVEHALGQDPAAVRDRAPRARRPAAAAGRSRGDRRSAPPRRAAAQAPSAAARPASRSCGDRGGRWQGTTSSRCGPRPVVPRSRSRSRRASSAVGGRRIALVDHPRLRETELVGAFRKRRARASAITSLRDSTSCAAERRDLLGPRRQRIARREARGNTTQGGVPLRNGSGVVDRQRRARRRETAERAVEVRAADCRPALHDCEPVRREHERRDLRTELLCGAQRAAVQLCALPLADAQRHLELDGACGRGCPSSRFARSSRRSGSAAHPHACAARSPACPTCSDSSRFVLPAPFGPTTRTSPGSRPRSSRAYERMLRSATSRTISSTG